MPTLPGAPSGSPSGTYDALRPELLDRLTEARAALDPALARIDASAARDQLGSLLERIGNFIATGDAGLYRAFLHTYLAMRAAEGQPPNAVLAMLIAIGQTCAQVARDAGQPELALMLARVMASTARAVNDLVAEELHRRLAQLAELRTHEVATVEPHP
jgi:hypothetical protein